MCCSVFIIRLCGTTEQKEQIAATAAKKKARAKRKEERRRQAAAAAAASESAVDLPHVDADIVVIRQSDEMPSSVCEEHDQARDLYPISRQLDSETREISVIPDLPRHSNGLTCALPSFGEMPVTDRHPQNSQRPLHPLHPLQQASLHASNVGGNDEHEHAGPRLAAQAHVEEHAFDGDPSEALPSPSIAASAAAGAEYAVPVASGADCSELPRRELEDAAPVESHFGWGQPWLDSFLKGFDEIKSESVMPNRMRSGGPLVSRRV